MRNFKYLALVVALFLANAPFASAGCGDLSGWDKAKWGMEGAELENIYGAALRLDDSIVSSGETNIHFIYYIPEFMVEKRMYRIAFGLNDEGKLQAVQLTAIFSDHETVTSRFDSVLAYLIDKYGEPAEKMSALKGTARTYFWNFLKARIIIQGMDPDVLKLKDLRKQFTITYLEEPQSKD